MQLPTNVQYSLLCRLSQVTQCKTEIFWRTAWQCGRLYMSKMFHGSAWCYHHLCQQLMKRLIDAFLIVTRRWRRRCICVRGRLGLSCTAWWWGWSLGCCCWGVHRLWLELWRIGILMRWVRHSSWWPLVCWVQFRLWCYLKWQEKIVERRHNY